MDLYHLFGYDIRKFVMGKTILAMTIVRPDKKTKKMYDAQIKPQAIKIFFSDGTSIQLDTWVEYVKPKKVNPTDPQHPRSMAYLTSLVRGKDRLALMLDQVKLENIKRREKL